VGAAPTGGRRAWPARWRERLTDLWEVEEAVLLRQVPFVVVFVLGLCGVLVARVPSTFTHELWAAVVIVGLVVVLAVVLPWRRLPLGARLVMPALQLLAVGALREGTGGQRSPYLSLVFLPVVLAASERGRRGVVLSTVASAAIILGPALEASAPGTSVEVARGVYLTLVVLFLGITVNTISERRRARTQALEELERTESRLLDDARASAVELAARSEEVRRARDLLAGVIDAATEQAIIGTDVHGVIDLFNPGAERLLGLPADDVLRRTRITDLHDPHELSRRRDELVRAAEPAGTLVDEGLFGALVGAAWGGGSEVRDWTYLRGDGRPVVVQVAVTRRLDPAGRTAGYIFVATDVTAEREASRLQDEFVSLISHELRTPLSSILGYLELTVDSGDLSDEQRQYVAVIERNANRLLRLVGDLLFTAQVEAGQFALVRGPVDVARSVVAAVESARPAAAAAGVEVVVTGCEVPVVLGADPVRLGQAWDNLVSNAVKFTPAGGRVVVDVTDGDRAVTVAVSDTGVGIPADEVEELFGRFFRASSATRNAVPGVGLGLTITRAIVTAHGGDLRVHSRIDEGTTFRVTLPRDVPPLGAAVPAVSGAASPRPASG